MRSPQSRVRMSHRRGAGGSDVRNIGRAHWLHRMLDRESPSMMQSLSEPEMILVPSSESSLVGPTVAEGTPARPGPRPRGVDPRIGGILDGRYRIVAALARGGMGVVYRGERLGLGRPV